MREPVSISMGYDRYGDPKLEEIFDNHYKAVLPRYIEQVLTDFSVDDIIQELGDPDFDRDAEGTEKQYASALLTKELDEVHYWDRVSYETALRTVLEAMFSETEYRPGDPDFVLCDVYDHGGSMWSLHGGGMRCQFDTSRGAGVWVPDDCLRSELDNVNPWAFVRRTPVNLKGTGKTYQLIEVSWNEAGPVRLSLNSVRMSDDWSSLRAEAKLIAEGKPEATAAHKFWARANQAEEYARQYLDQYNDIINGNVYGCVVQTYELVGGDEADESDRIWEEVGSNDACWGFVGSTYAMETLKSEYLDPAVANFKRSEVAA